MQGYIERAWELSLGVRPDAFTVFFPSGVRLLYGAVFYFFDFALGLELLLILQALAIAGSTVLLGRISTKLFGRSALQTLLMLFSILYWPFIAQVSFFMAEPVFSFLLLLSLELYLSGVKGLSTSEAHSSLRSLRFFAPAGLALGFSILLKGQGLVLLISFFLIHLFLKIPRAKLLSFLCLFLFAALPIAGQFRINSLTLGQASYFLSANDAYNAYLGSSRRKAIGCSEKDSGLFYIFHNNNSGLNYPFYEAAMIETPIMDREAFREMTKQLWRDDPLLQLQIGLHNVIELFEINPRWPLRNVSLAAVLDPYFQWGLLFFVGIPFLYGLSQAGGNRGYRAPMVILSLPLLGIAGVAFFTMGQPRYLLPFQYFLLLGAAPFYQDLFKLGARPTESRFTGATKHADAFTLLALSFMLLSAFLVYRAEQNIEILPTEDSYEFELPENQELLHLSNIDSPQAPFRMLSGDTPLSLRLYQAEILAWRKVARIHDRALLKIGLLQGQTRPSSIGIFLSEQEGKASGLIRFGAERRMISGLESGAWFFFDVPEHTAELELQIRNLTGPALELHSVMAVRSLPTEGADE